MRHSSQKPGADLKHEAAETLFLMAVLGGEELKEAALHELKRRKILLNFEEFEHFCIANLSGIC